MSYAGSGGASGDLLIWNGAEQRWSSNPRPMYIPLGPWYNVQFRSILTRTVEYGSELGLGQVNNLLYLGSEAAFGTYGRMPQGLDSSQPLTVSVGWQQYNNADPGDIELEVLIVRVRPGDDMSNLNILPSVSGSAIVAVPAVQQQYQRTDIPIIIAGTFDPGDVFAVRIQRNTIGNPDDTYPGDILAVDLEIEVYSS